MVHTAIAVLAGGFIEGRIAIAILGDSAMRAVLDAPAALYTTVDMYMDG